MHGKRGLYLDFYPPIIHSETHKETRREHLRLNIFEKPKTDLEKEHNKETKMLAENIRAQRQLEFQAGVYGFVTVRNKQKDFIAYFRQLAETKLKVSKSNYENWLSVLKYLENFTGGAYKFGDLSEKFCLDFKDFCLTKRRFQTIRLRLILINSKLPCATLIKTRCFRKIRRKISNQSNCKTHSANF